MNDTTEFLLEFNKDLNQFSGHLKLVDEDFNVIPIISINFKQNVDEYNTLTVGIDTVFNKSFIHVLGDEHLSYNGKTIKNLIGWSYKPEMLMLTIENVKIV